MIPLLNTGKDGLKAMADESDRLGLTISGKTGRAAEQFNDTLTKVGRIVEGVAMQIAEAALPALQDLANLLASPAFASAAQSFGQAIVSGLSVAIQVVTGLTNAARELFTYIAARAGEGFATVDEASIKTLEDRIANSKRILNDPGNAGQDMTGLRNTLAKEEAALAGRKFRDPLGKGADFGQLSAFGMGSSAGSSAPTLDMPTFSDAGGASAMAGRLEALRESLRTEEESEKESFARRREEIQKFYDDGLIQRGEYDELLLKAQQEHADEMTEIAKKQAEDEARIREQLVDNVAGIFGSLATIAENMGERGLAAAKAFGVAEAVVNTAQGITKALAQGGVFGFVGAAAVAAAGAAQISTILSTNKGSGSKPSVGASAGEVPAASTAAARSVSINLQGETFSRDAVGGLFQRLNEELGIDGLELVVNHRQA